MKAPSRNASQSLILVDGASADLNQLLLGARLPAGTIPPCPDPLVAIGELIRAQGGSLNSPSIFSTLHLVCHGQPGAILVGGQRLDTGSLTAAASELARWRIGEIVLWSCQSGADPAFVATLAELTGARVLATDTLLGYQRPELVCGNNSLILTDLFQTEVLERWGGTLINEYDVRGKQLNFAFGSATLIPNSGGFTDGSYATGTKFYYDNIVSVKDANGNDVKIGAIVTYIAKTDRTSLKVFDSSTLQYNTTTFPEANAFFQPNLEILNQFPRLEEGWADFGIEFVENYNATSYQGDAVLLDNLVVDIYDIDGSGASQTPRQFVEVDTVGGYSILAPSSVTTGSKLDIVETDSSIRFQAKLSDGANYTQLPGTTAGDAIRVSLNYDNGVSKFRFQIGDFNYGQELGALSNAYYAFNFGSNRSWSGPTYNFGLKALDTQVSECGGSSLLTVCIVGPEAVRPTANITVDLLDFISKSPVGSLANAVANPDGTLTINNEFILSKAQLIFTPENWSTPQTITVTGLDDSAFDGNFRFQGLLKATTTDDYYTGISTAVTIENLDNEISIEGCRLLQTTPWACFNIQTVAGRVLQFNTIDGSTTGIAAAAIEISSDGGQTWINYCTTTNSSKTKADIYKVPGNGLAAIKVRVAISPSVIASGLANNSFSLEVTSPGVPCPALATANLVAPATLGNRVWLDANFNGIQDSGEQGLADVTVELYRENNGRTTGPAIATTTSAADGSYSFTNLEPDAYIVRFISPDGAVLVAANQGDDSADSDADDDGFSQTYNLASGESNESADAGFLMVSSISGTIYHDVDNNGIQGLGEDGISGVVIRLTGTDSAGKPVSIVTSSNGNGDYSFTNLLAGSYTISESQPPGFLDGIDAAGSNGGSVGPDQINTINLAAGTDASGYNFAEILPASIGGIVFHDRNNDGSQDAGEPAISGVSITLNGSDDLGNAISLNTLSNAAGSYSFTDLRPGTYTLSETQPQGFLDGKDSIGSSGGTVGDDLISTINLSQDSQASGYNFGEIKGATIGGIVFHDRNNDGSQDAGEPAISGVSITLNGSDDLGNAISLNTLSNAAGSYSFTDLRPGTYTLSETQPQGFLDGKDSIGSSGGTVGDDLISTINLSQDSQASGYNFGEIKTASIGDRFWLDSNADGIQNEAENGLVGYSVTLISGGSDGLLSTAADNTSISTVTGADGLYGFANLLPGEYRVRFGDRPAGSVFSPADAGASDALDSDVNSSGDSPVLSLLSGEVNTTMDAGVYQSVSFGDRIWDDANGDGIQNGSEQGLDGVRVYLLDGSGNRISQSGVAMSTTTASDGSYSFSNLKPGSYSIEVERPSGYQFTARDRGVDDSIDSDVDGNTGKSSILTLLSGQSNVDLDAGLFRPVSLGDRIWHDFNANGIQDAGEPGISGVTVYLTDSSGSRILLNGLPVQRTTDNNGFYSFTGLTPSSYGIEVIRPSSDFAFSSKREGSDAALDSDLNAAGKSDPVALISGGGESSIDGGLFKLASLGDRVWADTNANGIQDAGEVGTAGLTVELYDPSGANLLQSTTTNLSGIYSFAGLTPGDYVVRFSKPADAYFSETGNGTMSTDNDAGADGFTSVISLASGDNTSSIDAGWNKLGSIGDVVWLDSNANGLQDGGELGYGGLQVDLYDEKSSTLLASTSTANDGSYQFSGLKAAKYVVRFSKPSDYLFSDSNLGDSDLLDSDADSSGQTVAITVNSGQAVTDVDAGIYKLGSIGDRIWNDVNSNGIQDSDESGLANISVGLYKADGVTLLSSTSSNSSGSYSFGSLRPDNYVVRVTKPLAYTITSKGSDASSGIDSNIDASGKSDIITLGSGEINTTIDAGLFLTPASTTSDLQISKSDGLTSVVAGQQITYTIVVKNVGSSAVSQVLVSDLMPTNLSGVTWSSKVDYGTVSGNDTTGSGTINDTITSLGGNSCVTYTVNATVVKPGSKASTALTSFDFKATSDSAKSGTAANSRIDSSGGVTITTRAFSREALSNGSAIWANAYLGSYTTGLGITNSAETTSDYRLDNSGSRKDYLLLQFSESVVLDKAYLRSVFTDSDATVWFGTSATLTSLSDAVLTALGPAEQSIGTRSDRTADINAANKVGNTIVISAANNETGNDNFTLAGLDIYKLILSGSSISNTATVSGPSGYQDSNAANNSATDLTEILTAPGCRTPGFWANTTWQTFWDGISNNEPSQVGSPGFASADIFSSPYKSGAQGTVKDPISGNNLNGVLLGDHNRNGLTDSGEQTIFYTTTEALKILNSSQQPDKSDVRYTLSRSLLASWLNYQAGNPIDTAASGDRDARFWINQGISWLQTYTPDENKDGKGDGMLSKLSSLSSPYMKASSIHWTNANLGGQVINTNLDAYNNGASILADNNVYGGSC